MPIVLPEVQAEGEANIDFPQLLTMTTLHYCEIQSLCDHDKNARNRSRFCQVVCTCFHRFDKSQRQESISSCCFEECRMTECGLP